MNIIANYNTVKEKIATAAVTSGRLPTDITLVAVTKGHTWQEIQPLYQEGLRIFGESRLQEALPKMAQAPNDMQWHFIGTLQKNKVNKVVPAFPLIHSVDSLELAQKISHCSQAKGVISQVLLQVNCSNEISKHGLKADEWENAFELLLDLPGLNVQGLMTMAAEADSEKGKLQTFASLRILRDKLNRIHPLPQLSMGMSSDFQLAIAEGATMVRIGSALFDIF